MPEARQGEVHVPVLMLAVVTLLWGWYQSALVYAVIAALALELVRVAPFRWAFDDDDFHRLGDVTTLGLVLLATVQFADRGLNGIYGILRWFPLVVLGLTLAQLYSTRRTVRLSAMFLSVRLALRRGRISYPGELDMRLPYLVACMLSACASPERSRLAVAAVAAVLVWLLWSNRPRRARLFQAVAALVLCAAVAAAAAGLVTTVRKELGPVIMDIVREQMAHWRDPFRSHTALGEIGRVKVSDRIVLRIEAPPATPVPALLHEATYTQLSNNVWLAGATHFDPLEPRAVGTRWHLAEDRRPFRTVTVSKNLIRNKGMLAVPAGAFRIDDLPVEELHRSQLGALKVVNGPDLVRYQVRYSDVSPSLAPPSERDLTVPPRIQPVVERTLDTLDLRGVDEPRAVIRRLAGFFNSEFSYTLELDRPALMMDPLEHFLEKSRKGHCEFFATATVMLLRAAGVPARYATGYSVQEYSPLEKAWVVRRRHSHAWASAWIGGRWVDVDTTPSQWVQADAAGASWWQPAYDLVSWMLHRFSRWRLEQPTGTEDNTILLWLLAPLSLFLAWRVYRSRRVGRVGDGDTQTGETDVAPGQGHDSAFFRIEAMLARRGLERPAAFTQRAWLERLAREGRLPPGGEDWPQMVDLHYRLRFGPERIHPGAGQRLRRAVERWLARADPGRAAGIGD